MARKPKTAITSPTLAAIVAAQRKPTKVVVKRLGPKKK